MVGLQVFIARAQKEILKKPQASYSNLEKIDTKDIDPYCKKDCLKHYVHQVAAHNTAY